MKKYSTFILLIFCFSFFFSQKVNVETWKQMNLDQRKESVKNMSSEDKKTLFQDLKRNVLLGELKISKENEASFSALYEEYQEKQHEIKNQFISKKKYEEMTDDEAKKELDKSFNIGQQLIENRRKYALKFQKIMSPQKILKLYQNEGSFRDKINEKRNPNSGDGHFKNNKDHNLLQ